MSRRQVRPCRVSFTNCHPSPYLVTLVCLTLVGASHAEAQAPPITSSGLHTEVTLSAPPPSGPVQYTITGGTRPGGASGTNLFHSFGNFSVPTNNIANFLNTGSVDLNGNVLAPNLPTSNILARVTGGDPSVIFGMIQTNGPGGFGNANLFLMNPHGFLFGPNATINVGGMVTFTTADYLRFQGTDILFNKESTPESLSLLSTVPVAAFGFLGSNPAAIAIQGSTLQVAQGQSLSLVGGNTGFDYIDPDTGTQSSVSVPNGLTITDGTLSAPGGQINLANVASAGEILADSLQPAPNVNGASFSAMGNVSLTGATILDTSGLSTGDMGAGGTVRIRSGQFVMDRALIVANTMGNIDGAPTAVDIDVNTLLLTNGSQINSSSQGMGTSGDISVTATEQIILSGFDASPLPGRFHVSFGFDSSGLFTGAVADGDGGAIHITTPSLIVDNAAHVAALNSGNGQGGNVSIHVASLDLRNGGRISTLGGLNYLTDELGTGFGQAGAINVSASNTVNLAGFGPGNSNSVIQSHHFGSGTSGAITLDASTIQLENRGSIETHAGFGGPAGDITLTVSDLIGTSGGAIATVGSDATPSGNISINAANSITFSGQSEGIRSGIRNENVQFGGTGNIHITTRTLQLSDTARIISDTFIDFVNPPDLPKLTVEASEAITLISGSELRVMNFLSDVGSLTVSAPTITLSGQSAIATTTFLDGNAGMLNIHGRNLTLSSGSLISSSTTDGAGRAGDIALSLDGQVRVNGGRIENSSGPFATGDAGKITISAASVLVDNGGAISTSTQFTGNAGTIEVNTGAMTLKDGGSVTSNSVTRTVPLFEGEEIPLATGNAGNIHINAGKQFTMMDSTVTTEATQSGGGAIKITTDPSGTVQLIDSLISASVLDGTGGGGSVNIDPQFVILVNSHILATAVHGAGGNIFLTTNLLLSDANSMISASSQFGQNGTVTIQSPNAPVSGQIHPLGKTPLLATSLFNHQCASVAGGQFSSFTVAGRDSLPAEPGSWLISPLYATATREGLSGLSNLSGVSNIVRARLAGHHMDQSDKTNQQDHSPLSLRKIAPAGFLTQAFAVDRSAGCSS